MQRVEAEALAVRVPIGEALEQFDADLLAPLERRTLTAEQRLLRESLGLRVA